MSEPAIPAAQPGRRAAFGFIFASALMNAISFGIMIPILPNLIKQFTGGDTAAASEWNVLFGTSWGLMQFVCGPFLGLLSDRIGRRPVLLISFFGLGVDFLFMAFAPTLMWLYVGRIINGMTSASFSTANAYLADVTEPQNRAKMFGMLGSAFGFGFVIGPTLGGILGEYNLRLPFIAAAILTMANWLYGYFILPESLPVERRATSFDWRKANALGSLRLLRSHPGLVRLASIGFLFQFAQMVLPSIFVLYTGYRYGWTPKTMGITLAATGISGILVQTLLVGRVVGRIGERGAVLLASACGAIGFAWYGASTTGWVYLMAVPVFALLNLLQPGLQGLMTRQVPPNQQGQLQGAMQSLTGISSILGPMLYGLVFAWSVRNNASLHMPGLAVYVAGSLLVLAFVLALGMPRLPAPDAELN